MATASSGSAASLVPRPPAALTRQGLIGLLRRLAWRLEADDSSPILAIDLF
jgi:hypothetical protein